MPTTLEDIARALKVSKMTVSRAIRLWPSLILLLVPLAETVTHFRLLFTVATGDANWLPHISFVTLPAYVIYGFGASGLRKPAFKQPRATDGDGDGASGAAPREG